jgi:hypothetical protein
MYYIHIAVQTGVVISHDFEKTYTQAVVACLEVLSYLESLEENFEIYQGR